MAHTIWSGALSFGLVNIPVHLVSAVNDRAVHFHLLHDKDGAQVHEKRVCSKDGEEVPWAHIVKGYEVAKGRMVQVTNQELEALAPPKSRAIDLLRFVELASINPFHFQRPYYLVPAEGANKAYTLLQTVLEQSARVGIGRLVMRDTEYLVAIRPIARVLALSTLWAADELVAPETVTGLPKAAAVPAQQLTLARQIVESLSGDFLPESLENEQRGRIRALLARKAKGAKSPVVPAETAPAKVLDLMSALKASLAATGKPEGKTGGSKQRKGKASGGGASSGHRSRRARAG